MKQELLLQQFLDEWETSNSISAHTSGSTGTPKQIQLPKSQVVRSALRSNKYFGITKNSRLHAAMSFEFIGGKMMIARSLLSGCLLTYSDPTLKLNIPDSFPISLLSLVPAQMHYVLENLPDFANIEKFLIGGSAIDDRLWDRIVSSGVQAWESYGMTETATHVAMRRITGPAVRRPRFVALPGVKISTDSNDCICIRDGEVYVQTNDMAVLHHDGTFEIIGRKDDIINTGGLKIIPQKLEKIIQEYVSDFFKEFYITSIPDEIWTSKLVIAGIPLIGTVEPTLKERIQNAIESIPLETLPKRMRPKNIVFLKELPRTKMGKLNRKIGITELPEEQ